MSRLDVQGVSVRFDGVAALDGVSLAVESGRRLAVVGPSGSGKSTLLRVLAGFEVPERGTVRLGDAVLTENGRCVPTHRRGVGLVAQEGALFPHLSVADNIGFGLPRRDRAGRVAELAALVGLDAAMLLRHPDALSGGQQQRAALARALACRPRLMLLDEPFSALDTALRAGTRRAVAALLARAGVTTVLVTHDQEEAMSFADHLAVLRNGRLLQAGSPRELYLRPVSEFVARFLGDAIILPAILAGEVARCCLGTLPVPGNRLGEGPVRVMLRPEQVMLGTGPVTARVGATDFAGGACTASLHLPGGETVSLRAPQNAVPAEGETVQVGLCGTAHLLPDVRP